MLNRSDSQLASGAARPAGVGVLVFAVLVLAFLYWILRPDEHPLALARGVSLCEALGSGPWAVFTTTGDAGTSLAPRPGASAGVCELHAGNGSALTGAAGPVATAMLTTEADLRYQNMGQSLGKYLSTFVAEMKASGYDEIEVPLNWRRTYGFRSPSGESVLLVDDEGVFLWISSTRFPIESLLQFAEAATAELRRQPAG